MVQDLSKKQRQRIIADIQLLADMPRPNGVRKLKEYYNTYRIRIGDYRVIYKIKDKEVLILILSCTHRKDAY